MPTFRIVYIDDETFAPRSLTASFPDRAAVVAAMAKHGHRIVHLAELRAGELISHPIELRIVGADAGNDASSPRERTTATHPFGGLPRYDIARIVVMAVALAAVSAALLLF